MYVTTMSCNNSGTWKGKKVEGLKSSYGQRGSSQNEEGICYGGLHSIKTPEGVDSYLL